ncbi:MAG: DUF2480 family protein [Bacteroidetes bacterium]|nr:DUF2480 family protein [Bacteroidota bacterium]
MDAVKPIVNKVAQSALITLALETFFPKEEEIACIDLKDFLFRGLILREEEFRNAVKNKDWEEYRDKCVAIYCSSDAIIPMWAYMILSVSLSSIAKDVAATAPLQAPETFLLRNLIRLDANLFQDKRVLVKGCGDRKISEAAFVQIADLLTPVVRSLMYGEACSNVPIFKKANQ